MNSKSESYWRELHPKLIQGLRDGKTLEAMYKEEGTRANTASYNFKKYGLDHRLMKAASSKRGVTGKPAGFVRFVPDGSCKPKLEVCINGCMKICVDNDDVQGLKTIMSCCTLEAA